jgi:hypothetical protein
MKNLLVVLLLVLTTSTFAQKTIKLKVVYLPNHQYNMETKNISKIVMDAQVDEATKEQLKSSGMTLPLMMDMDQNTLAEMKTGQLNSNKEIPITIEYTRNEVKQMMGEKELPSQGNALKGMKATGFGDSNGKIRIENVEGEGVTDPVKKLMISMSDQMGMQIAFPEKPMKVGDEFTQEVPMNMPIQGGAELKMIVKTIYKLTSFTSENALFDTTMIMTMDISMNEGSMTAEGAGKGKITFDIKKNFMSTYNSNLDMKMKMKMGPMDMDIKSSTQSEVVVTHL